MFFIMFLFFSIALYVTNIFLMKDIKNKFFDEVNGRLRRLELEVDEIGRKFINK